MLVHRAQMSARSGSAVPATLGACVQAAENYDWRLSIVDLERRDNYFTILQNRVELLHSTNGEKARPLGGSCGTVTEQVCVSKSGLSADARKKLFRHVGVKGGTAWQVIGTGSRYRVLLSTLSNTLQSLFIHLGSTSQQTEDVLRSQVVVLAHSWGDNVWRTFMRWVTVDDPGWVERHLAAYVNIAGTVLGLSKSTTSLLSGDGSCTD